MGVALRLRTNEVSMASEVTPLLAVGCLTNIESDIPIDIHRDATQRVWIFHQEPAPKDTGNVIGTEGCWGPGFRHRAAYLRRWWVLIMHP